MNVNNKELKKQLKIIKKDAIKELEFLIYLSKKYKLNNTHELKSFIQNKKMNNHFISRELKKVINNISEIENIETINKKNISLGDEFEKIINKNWGD